MLYIHIPICASKCHYCSFYSVGARGVAQDELTASICRELSERRGEYSEPLRTIYFGGGTPSILSEGNISEIFRAIRLHYDTSQVTEITFEANPEQLTVEYLRALRLFGINRLSIGTQSFDNSRLRSIGRRHSVECAEEAVSRAREVGFDNISIDLMFGFEDLTLEEWERSISRALALNPQHISAYQLTIEEGTLFSRRGVTTASDEMCFEQYRILCERLAAAGYEHYEISNFSLPGYGSRHNSSYWTGAKYLGIGPSAHSYDGARERRWNLSSIKEYLERTAYESEHLSDTDLHNEYIMTRLRTSEGIDLAEYRIRFNRELLTEHTEAELTALGLHTKENHLYIPESAMFTSDTTISALFWD